MGNGRSDEVQRLLILDGSFTSQLDGLITIHNVILRWKVDRVHQWVGSSMDKPYIHELFINGPRASDLGKYVVFGGSTLEVGTAALALPNERYGRMSWIDGWRRKEGEALTMYKSARATPFGMTLNSNTSCMHEYIQGAPLGGGRDCAEG